MSVKKLLILLTLIGLIVPSLRAEEENADKIRVIREAQEKQKNTVAVEGYLIDNVFEVSIIVRMYRTRPMIYNALVVGSGLGRLSCDSRKTLVATAEEEEPFLTKRKDKAFISFRKSEAVKKARGTMIKELLRFDIPVDKIKEDKKYRLWVQVVSSQKGSKYKTFKFDLEDFAELLKK